MERTAPGPAADAPAYQGHATAAVDLVLEGGAMRGQFTAGVCDALMERSLFCDRVIGVSAGALCGWYYVAGYRGQTAYLNAKYCQDWRYLSLKSYALTGNACGRDFMFRQIPEKLEPIDYGFFNRSSMTLVSVASDLETGEADYHTHLDSEEGRPYLIASSSIPLVSQIVEVDGKKLLDGGTCDSIPIIYSQITRPNTKRIVVCTHHADFEREPDKLAALERQVYRDFPYYLDRLECRHIEYNRTYRALKRMHAAKDAFVIWPEHPVTVSNMEKDRDALIDLYLQGYEVAHRLWPALAAYLES